MMDHGRGMHQGMMYPGGHAGPAEGDMGGGHRMHPQQMQQMMDYGGMHQQQGYPPMAFQQGMRSSAPPYQMYGYPHMPQPMGMPYGYGMPPQDGNFPMQGVPPSGVMMSARPQEVSEQVGGHGENGFAQAEDAPEATPPVSRRRKAPDDEDDAETAAEEDLMPAEPLLLGIRLREPCEMITYGLDKLYSSDRDRGSYFKDVLQEQSWLNTDQLPMHHFMRHTDVRHKPPKKALPDLSGMLEDKRLRKRIKYKETDRFNRMRKQFVSVTEMGANMSVELEGLADALKEAGDALYPEVVSGCMQLMKVTKDGIAKNDKLHKQNIGNFNFILKTHQPLIEMMCNQQMQKDEEAASTFKSEN